MRIGESITLLGIRAKSCAIGALLLSASCSASKSEGESCLAGEQRACACPNSSGQGVQTCNADGNSLGECRGCADGNGAAGVSMGDTIHAGRAGTASSSQVGNTTLGGMDTAGASASLINVAKGGANAGAGGKPTETGGSAAFSGAATGASAGTISMTSNTIPTSGGTIPSNGGASSSSGGTIPSNAGASSTSGGTMPGGAGGGSSGTAGGLMTAVAPSDAAGGGGAAGTAGVVAGAAGTGCTASQLEAVSNGLCIARLVVVGDAGGDVGSAFAIDATEVTRGQFEAWAATQPPRPATTVCDPSDTFLPVGVAYPGATCGASMYQGSDSDHHPVVCIDACDAKNYCKGVGKRLCGRRAEAGGGAFDTMSGELAQASISQWYAACSSGGANAFPYAKNFSDYDPIACNSYDYWQTIGTPTTTVVGSRASCQAQGAFSGVYDLSGNVWEWNDAGPVYNYRAVVGGSFKEGAANVVPVWGPTTSFLTCSGSHPSQPAGQQDPGTGFRCCKDL